MKIILLTVLLMTSINAKAATAYLTGEYITGTTKQCYYNYGLGTYTLTIKAYSLCPLSIQV